MPLEIRFLHCTCGSGRAREESSAVDGTGAAGVRGLAHSHMDCVSFRILSQTLTMRDRLQLQIWWSVIVEITPTEQAADHVHG